MQSDSSLLQQGKQDEERARRSATGLGAQEDGAVTMTKKPKPPKPKQRQGLEDALVDLVVSSSVAATRGAIEGAGFPPPAKIAFEVEACDSVRQAVRAIMDEWL